MMHPFRRSWHFYN